VCLEHRKVLKNIAKNYQVYGNCERKYFQAVTLWVSIVKTSMNKLSLHPYFRYRISQNRWIEKYA
jgi:hypothetical protein